MPWTDAPNGMAGVQFPSRLPVVEAIAKIEAFTVESGRKTPLHRVELTGEYQTTHEHHSQSDNRREPEIALREQYEAKQYQRRCHRDDSTTGKGHCDAYEHCERAVSE